MGVERAVTLWYIQQQFILDEIALLEAQLAQLQARASGTHELPPIPQDDTTDEASVLQELAKARRKICALGPCPRPMMG